MEPKEPKESGIRLTDWRASDMTEGVADGSVYVLELIHEIRWLSVSVMAAALIANGTAPVDAMVVCSAAHMRRTMQNPDPDEPDFKLGTIEEQAVNYLESLPRIRREERERKAKIAADREAEKQKKLERRAKRDKHGLKAVTTKTVSIEPQKSDGETDAPLPDHPYPEPAA